MINQKRFEEISSRFKNKKILIYGDIILDRYIFGSVSRISPEAPVPVLKIHHEECRLGGAGNVCANLHALGATAILLGVTGNDLYSKEISKLKYKNNLIQTNPANKTLVKTRVISQRQQIVRIDREEGIHLTPELEAEIINSINQLHLDGIIVSDYAKGTVNKKVMEFLKKKAKSNQIPIIVDPKPPNFDLYNSIHGITPNLKEAEQIINKKIQSDQDAVKAAKTIRKKFKTSFSMITRGDQGMTVSEVGVKTFHVPAIAHEVFDVTGAGDTVVSMLTLSLVSGASLKEAALLSNAAASIVIEKVGTSQVHVDELRERLHFLTNR
jgi:D-beta-D-heptose 7-phosphate kinase/D-beta-D-heptose 1-phosphate adenosyltransferase